MSPPLPSDFRHPPSAIHPVGGSFALNPLQPAVVVPSNNSCHPSSISALLSVLCAFCSVFFIHEAVSSETAAIQRTVFIVQCSYDTTFILRGSQRMALFWL